ncbi:MAG: WD40 repeat domain-containing protein [Ignavibacteria bacterium]|nr:WD40 repeat domain-containing protein [Ignavibacteria bacterium]
MKTPLRFVRIKFIYLFILAFLINFNSVFSQTAKNLNGHTGNINYISFSPDATKFISAGEDGKIYFWDTESAEKINTITIGGNITCAKFSPDGKYIGVTTYEGNNFLLDGQTGVTLQKLVFKPNSYGICFSNTCGCFAVNYFTITDEYKKNILGSTSQVKMYHFKVDVYQSGNYTRPAELNLFDEDKSGLTFVLGQNLVESYRTNLFTCRLSDNGEYLYTSLPNGNVSETNLKTKKVTMLNTGHKNRVNYIEFSPDRTIFASAGKDEVIKVKNRVGNPNTRALQNHTGDICAIDFSPDGKYLISASDDKTVKVWNVETTKEIITLRGSTSDVITAAFSPDGRYIVSGGKDAVVRVYSTENFLPDLKNFTTKFEAKTGIYVQVEKERKAELDAIADMFRPKDEFESTDDYNARIRNAEQVRADINKKYDDKLSVMKESKETEVTQIETTEKTITDIKIEQSRKDTIIRIDYLGKYDADRETYPVIIKGKSGFINISKGDAQSLKGSFKLADVKCKKELNRDLKTYNYYDFIIVHPTTRAEYVFDDGSKKKEEVNNQYEGSKTEVENTTQNNGTQVTVPEVNVSVKQIELYDLINYYLISDNEKPQIFEWSKGSEIKAIKWENEKNCFDNGCNFSGKVKIMIDGKLSSENWYINLNGNKGENGFSSFGFDFGFLSHGIGGGEVDCDESLKLEYYLGRNSFEAKMLKKKDCAYGDGYAVYEVKFPNRKTFWIVNLYSSGSKQGGCGITCYFSKQDAFKDLY